MKARTLLGSGAECIFDTRQTSLRLTTFLSCQLQPFFHFGLARRRSFYQELFAICIIKGKAIGSKVLRRHLRKCGTFESLSTKTVAVSSVQRLLLLQWNVFFGGCSRAFVFHQGLILHSHARRTTFDINFAEILHHLCKAGENANNSNWKYLMSHLRWLSLLLIF